MDSTTLATGFATTLASFASDFGPIILTVVGIAVGLYGVKVAYGWLTNLVRARAR